MTFEGKSVAEIETLFAQTLQNGMHGLCFSPYSEHQAPGDSVPEPQIRRRMEVVAPHTRWIRSFACTQGHEEIPKVAKEYGLRTLVGAWISDDKVRNEAEIEALVRLAKAGLVDVAAVGNEVLQRNELSEHEIVGYLRRVRALLPAHIPVGYVDAYYHFIEKPSLIEASDLVLINCYPFWEEAENEHALYYLERMVELTTQAAAGKKVVVTETGWPSAGKQATEGRYSAANAMKYFVNVQQWSRAKDVEVFYFSSFDEPWKTTTEGEVGAQWGIWDTHEAPKFVPVSSHT
jgi:GPH family glycoside/pentoside/hexuronide:cation symporter